MRAGRLTGSVIPLRFESFSGVTHGISTRHGGTSTGPYSSLNLGMSTGDLGSNVRDNREVFFDSLGLKRADVLVGRLSHGNKVTVFDGRAAAVQSGVRDAMVESVHDRCPSFYSDAVVSNVSGLHFMITAADCVPLAFLDKSRGIVGAAHAGWRGTAGAIAAQVVRAMKESLASDPSSVVVGIGPSVGPCCYSVTEEVLDTFTAQGHDPVVQEREGKHYLDLWSTNSRQLVRAGVRPESIENVCICTVCHVDAFFSHRAEAGRTGRFALCIGQ